MPYNKKYYFDGVLHQLKPKAEAIHTYVLSDGTIIAMFQGKRGSHPDLDFIIRLLREGEDERPTTPPHVYWIVNLIIKSQRYPEKVKEIVEYYLDFYDKCVPFNSIQERAQYEPLTVEEITSKYADVVVNKTLPIDYIALVIELFCVCEKRNEGAYMFKDLLNKVKAYIDGDLDYMHLLQGFKYRTR